MGRPKENPEDKKARLRERRLSGLEQDKSAMGTAADLTTDLRAVYGLRGLPLLPSVAASMPVKKPAMPSTRPDR